MCGIAGILSLSGRPAPLAPAARMLKAQRHRGPDGSGLCAFTERSPVWLDEDHPQLADPAWAVLGHNRLAILDLSDAGRQPMFTPDQRYALSFNGEIYNYLELAELHLAGQTRQSSSDTEVLLRLLAREQDKCLPRLNGMWGFALVDQQQRSVLLSRDRFGIKPVYLARTPDYLLFASEIRTLFASGLLPVRLRPLAVVNLLLYDDWSMQDGLTFYEGITQLAPGSWQQWNTAGRHTAARFFDLRHEALEPTRQPLADLIRDHRDLFRDAVALRLRSDVRVGSCLSGGVDSTNVVVAAADLLRQHGQQMHAFTIAMRDRDIDETADARLIAQTNDCLWRSCAIEDRITFDDVLDFIFTNEEPLPMIGSIVQYELYRFIAQSGVKVVLDGQGGDEAYCGYTWFYHNLLDALPRWQYPWWRWQVGRRCNADRAMFRRWGRLDKDPLARLNPAIRSVLLDPRLDQPESTTWQRIAAARSWSDRQAAACECHELRYLLRDGDRNAMRWGVESRYPFLDYRILLRTNRMDQRLLMRGGWTKFISRSFPTARQAPRPVIWNQTKRGFYNNPQHNFEQAALDYLRVSRADLGDQLGAYLEVDGLLDLVGAGKLRWWRMLSLAALIRQMKQIVAQPAALRYAA